MRFVDSHLHMSEQDAADVLSLSQANGTLLLSCGTDKESSAAAVKIAQQSPGSVKAFVGIHPSEVEKSSNLTWLAKSLENATGVGEIGLDPKYSPVGRESNQMKAFSRQLEMVQRNQVPVQVHSRGAERECIDVLGGFRLKSVLMHWFQGEALVSSVQDRGYFVSFGPALLSSKKLQRMAVRFDPALVLTESDSPVAYSSLEGANGPSLIPSVVNKVAELYGRSFESGRELISQNALRYLGDSGKG